MRIYSAHIEYSQCFYDLFVRILEADIVFIVRVVILVLFSILNDLGYAYSLLEVAVHVECAWDPPCGSQASLPFGRSIIQGPNGEIRSHVSNENTRLPFITFV